MPYVVGKGYVAEPKKALSWWEHIQELGRRIRAAPGPELTIAQQEAAYQEEQRAKAARMEPLREIARQPPPPHFLPTPGVSPGQKWVAETLTQFVPRIGPPVPLGPTGETVTGMIDVALKLPGVPGALKAQQEREIEELYRRGQITPAARALQRITTAIPLAPTYIPWSFAYKGAEHPAETLPAFFRGEKGGVIQTTPTLPLGILRSLAEDPLAVYLLGPSAWQRVTQRLAARTAKQAVGGVVGTIESAVKDPRLSQKVMSAVSEDVARAATSGQEAYNSRLFSAGVRPQVAAYEDVIGTAIKRTGVELPELEHRTLVDSIGRSLRQTWRGPTESWLGRLREQRFVRGMEREAAAITPTGPQVRATEAYRGFLEEAKTAGRSVAEHWRVTYGDRPIPIGLQTLAGRPISEIVTPSATYRIAPRTSTIWQTEVVPQAMAYVERAQRLHPQLTPDIFTGTAETLRRALISPIREQAGAISGALRALEQVQIPGVEIVPYAAPPQVSVGPAARPPTPASTVEPPIAEIQRDIKVTGTARHGDVSVKIVQHPDVSNRQLERRWAVETTVAGDRRLPREAPMLMEEAQAFAIAQLSQPRPAIPTARPVAFRGTQYGLFGGQVSIPGQAPEVRQLSLEEQMRMGVPVAEEETGRMFDVGREIAGAPQVVTPEVPGPQEVVSRIMAELTGQTEAVAPVEAARLIKPPAAPTITPPSARKLTLSELAPEDTEQLREIIRDFRYQTTQLRKPLLTRYKAIRQRKDLRVERIMLSRALHPQRFDQVKYGQALADRDKSDVEWWGTAEQRERHRALTGHEAFVGDRKATCWTTNDEFINYWVTGELPSGISEELRERSIESAPTIASEMSLPDSADFRKHGTSDAELEFFSIGDKANERWMNDPQRVLEEVTTEYNRVNRELVAKQREYEEELANIIEEARNAGYGEDTFEALRRDFAKAYEPELAELQAYEKEMQGAVARTGEGMEAAERAYAAPDIPKAKKIDDMTRAELLSLYEQQRNLRRLALGQLGILPEEARPDVATWRTLQGYAAETEPFGPPESTVRLPTEVPMPQQIAAKVEKAVKTATDTLQKHGITPSRDFVLRQRDLKRQHFQNALTQLQAEIEEISERPFAERYAELITQSIRAGELTTAQRVGRSFLQTITDPKLLDPLYGIEEVVSDALRETIRGVEQQTAILTEDVGRQWVGLSHIERTALNLVASAMLHEVRTPLRGVPGVVEQPQLPGEPGIAAGRLFGLSPAIQLQTLMGMIQGRAVDVSPYLDPTGLVVESKLPADIRRVWDKLAQTVGYYGLAYTGGAGIEGLQPLWNEYRRRSGARAIGHIEGYLPKPSIGRVEVEELLTILPEEVRGATRVRLDEAITEAAKHETAFHKLTEAVLRGRPLSANEQRLLPLYDPILTNLSYAAQLEGLQVRTGIYRIIQEFYPSLADWHKEMGPGAPEVLARLGWEPFSVTVGEDPWPGLENYPVPSQVANALRTFYYSHGLIPRMNVTLSTVRSVLGPIQEVILATVKFVQAQVFEQFFNLTIADLIPFHPVATLKGFAYTHNVIARAVAEDFMRVPPATLGDHIKKFFADLTLNTGTVMGLSEEKARIYLAEARKLGVIHASIGRVLREEARHGIGRAATALHLKPAQIDSLADAYMQLVFGYDDVGRMTSYIGLRELGETPQSARKILEDTAVEYTRARETQVGRVFRGFALFYQYRIERVRHFTKLIKERPIYPYLALKYRQLQDEMAGYDKDFQVVTRGGQPTWMGPEWSATPWNSALLRMVDAKPPDDGALNQIEGPHIVWVRKRIPLLEEIGEWLQYIFKPTEQVKSLFPPPWAMFEAMGERTPRTSMLHRVARAAPGVGPYVRAFERRAPGQRLARLPAIGRFMPEISSAEVVRRGLTPLRAKVNRTDAYGHPIGEAARQRAEVEKVEMNRGLETLGAWGFSYYAEPLLNCLRRLSKVELEQMIQQRNNVFPPELIARELQFRERGVGPQTELEKAVR